MVTKIRHFFLLAVYFSLTLLLSGCHFALLDPKGVIAADEKSIMVMATFLMLLVVVPVFILTFIFAWRYRETNVKAAYSPSFSHSTPLEIIWWFIPCVIVSILGYITWQSTHRLDPYKPLTAAHMKPLTIQAISLEWKWLFIYPEQQIATVNYVQIPVGVPIQFLISAEGPMNSFQILQLAGQIYAMAGMQTKLHLQADVPGEYRGISANFTGNGFSDMKFAVHASSLAQFNQWIKTVKKSPQSLNFAQYQSLVKPSEKNPVEYFSSVNKNIFETVVMKSMMLMPMEDMTPISDKVKNHA